MKTTTTPNRIVVNRSASPAANGGLVYVVQDSITETVLTKYAEDALGEAKLSAERTAADANELIRRRPATLKALRAKEKNLSRTMLIDAILNLQSIPAEPKKKVSVDLAALSAPKDQPLAGVFGEKTGMDAGTGKAGKDAKGVMRNSLGLESTEDHRHVAKAWQEQCIPLPTIYDQIMAEAKTKFDELRDRKGVRLGFSKEGNPVLAPREGYPSADLTERAVNSLIEFTDVPTGMVRWLREKGYQGDAARYVNQALDSARRGSDGQFLVRNRVGDGGKSVVRHIASENYGVMDSWQVMDALRQVLSEMGGWDKGLIGYMSGDPDTLQAHVILPDQVKTYPDSDYAVGFALRNSEVGWGRFSLSPWILRAICFNGSQRERQDSEIQVNRTHLGVVNWDDLKNQIREAITVATTLGWSMVDAMQGLRGATVEDPSKTIAHLARINRLPASMGREWYKDYFLEPEAQTYPNAFWVVQGLTRAAQRHEGDDRRQMELLAGELLAPIMGKPVAQSLPYWDAIERSAKNVTPKVLREYAVGVADAKV